MRAAKRRFEASVIQRLIDSPHRFQFFQAVRMLESLLKQNRGAHVKPVAEYLRFHNSLSLGFPASELEALQLEPKTVSSTAVGLLEALQKDQLNHIAITPTFIGFLGGSGALPNHYTERIAAHLQYEKDESPKAFLDTFSNRAVALFYEAWRKYRLEFNDEISGKNRFLSLLLALAGFGNKSLQGRLTKDGVGILDESLGYYAAALQQRPASALYIQQVLSDYFSVPIRAEQFIGSWYDVPSEQRTKLGNSNVTLGSDALVGARVWQRDLRVRLTIGPLDKKEYDTFLPGNSAAKSLEKMLTMFTNVCLEYEIQLVLRAQDVHCITLTSTGNRARLGWDTVLMTVPGEIDRVDARYEIHAL